MAYSKRNRNLTRNSDFLRREAEVLAEAVDTYLYDADDDSGTGGYRDLDFLAWSRAKYDAAKTGSGRHVDIETYDAASTSLKYETPPVEE